jgi:hypothetical protein
MQQRAMQVMGLSQQMSFEQGQAGQAAKFNQGQFISGGGGGSLPSSLTSGSGTRIVVTKSGQKMPNGLEILQYNLVKDGKVIDSFIGGVTGQGRNQSAAGTARANVAGSMTPLPDGSWAINVSQAKQFANQYDRGQFSNYKPSQIGSGQVGPAWIGADPKFNTGRSGIGFHLENVSPGSAGCLVFTDPAQIRKIADWVVKSGASNMTVALGANAAPMASSQSRGSGGANSRGNAIAQAAKILGINPLDLATIIEFESDGIPNRRGGAGGNYQGLIQFGPAERKKYGYNPGMSFEDQVLGPVVRYFKDRFKGVGMSTQGATLEDLYTTVLAGNPKANRGARDAFGTSARSGVQKMLKPGADRDIALKKYFGGNAPGGGGAGGGVEAYGLANVPNVTVTQLDLQAKLNELHTEQSINLREQAIEQAELNKLIQEQANIAPQMMRDNLRQLKEQTRQIEVESNLLRLQGEERKDYLAQLEYEKLYKNEILALEQAIRDTSDPVQKLALQKALVEAVKQEGEVRAAIAVNQAAQDQLEAQRKQVEWAESQIQSLKSLTFSMSVMNQEQEMAVRMADNMGNAFADAFTRFVTGTGTAQEAFAGFMSGMVSVFAQEVQRMVAVAVANNLFPGLLNLFGGGGAPSLFGGGFSGGPGFSIGGITGGVASGVALPGFSVPALADGGVVRKPTMALIGERGPEAVVPLDQMGGVNSVVNVTVNNDGSVKTDSNQGNELGRAIQRAVVDEIARQKRSGGLLASVK